MNILSALNLEVDPVGDLELLIPGDLIEAPETDWQTIDREKGRLFGSNLATTIDNLVWAARVALTAKGNIVWHIPNYSEIGTVVSKIGDYVHTDFDGKVIPLHISEIAQAFRPEDYCVLCEPFDGTIEGTVGEVVETTDKYVKIKYKNFKLTIGHGRCVLARRPKNVNIT